MFLLIVFVALACFSQGEKVAPPDFPSLSSSPPSSSCFDDPGFEWVFCCSGRHLQGCYLEDHASEICCKNTDFEGLIHQGNQKILDVFFGGHIKNFFLMFSDNSEFSQKLPNFDFRSNHTSLPSFPSLFLSFCPLTYLGRYSRACDSLARTFWEKGHFLSDSVLKSDEQSQDSLSLEKRSARLFRFLPSALFERISKLNIFLPFLCDPTSPGSRFAEFSPEFCVTFYARLWQGTVWNSHSYFRKKTRNGEHGENQGEEEKGEEREEAANFRSLYVTEKVRNLSSGLPKNSNEHFSNFSNVAMEECSFGISVFRDLKVAHLLLPENLKKDEPDDIEGKFLRVEDIFENMTDAKFGRWFFGKTNRCSFLQFFNNLKSMQTLGTNERKREEKSGTQESNSESSLQNSAQKSKKVLILLSGSPNSLQNPVFRAGASLWECYARRHGYDFVIDTKDYGTLGGGDAPPFFGVVPRSPSATRQMAYLAESGVPTLVNNKIPASVGWLKWRAAFAWLLQALEAKNETPDLDNSTFPRLSPNKKSKGFDFLVLVDPDMLISPSCSSFPLESLLDEGEGTHVWVRDYLTNSEINAGFGIFRVSSYALSFLSSLLSKSLWWGPPLVDQDCFAETLLEFAGKEAVEQGRSERGYECDCQNFIFPSTFKRYSEADQVVCFHEILSRLGVGKNGARRTEKLKFVHPYELDLNYRATGREAFKGQPFVVHFAGNHDKVGFFDWYLAHFNLSLPLLSSSFPHPDCKKIFNLSEKFKNKCTLRSYTDMTCRGFLCG